MNSIVLVLCLVITRSYGLDVLSPNTTVSSASVNLTDLIEQQTTTTEFPVELIVTTYQPLLIPIPTTNPKFNTENIDNNVNDEKSEKFSPNIYAETIFLPVAPNNYRPDLTHESLSRSNKFNLLDFTSYIHPPVLPDLSGNSPDFPKAEKLVDSNRNVDTSDYKRRLKKSKKAGKLKKAHGDHSNYPKPYAVHDDNYYPNNFYEYFKNDFYRNHRDRYDIDPQLTKQQIQAQYYNVAGGNCPGGGHHNLAQQAPPLYYNYAMQPISFHGHPKDRGDAEEEEEEEEEEEDDEDEEGEEEQEEGQQHTEKQDKKEGPEEKTSEKQKKAENVEEQSDYSDYNEEEEVEGDDSDEERKQNLKFQDTEEEERFHLDREKIRDDREKFRSDHEKIRGRDSDEEEGDSEEDYVENGGDEDEVNARKKKGGQKKSAKARKKGDDDDEDEEDDEEYEDEEEESAEKLDQTKPAQDAEIVESTTMIIPPTTQRVATFKIAPRPPLTPIETSYFLPITTTESPSGDFTTVAGFRRRMNIVQQKLKRLNLLPESTTPLYDISTLLPTSIPARQQRRPNNRYTQLTTDQPFIINTNDDVSQVVDPKAQYENIAEDAQQEKTETKTYTVAPRRFRLPPGQNQNNNDGASNEQFTNEHNNRNIVRHYNAGVTTPISNQPENGQLYSQHLYFGPREQPPQNPNLYNYNQPKLVYNHPTQIQRPQVFPLTPETPNLNPNLIQHPAHARQNQPQSRIKKQNYVTQPINYQTYTLYKHKRDIVPDSSSDIKYSSSYRTLNDNTPNTTNESDVASSNYVPVSISSGGRRTIEESDSKLDGIKTTTVVPDVKKTEDGGKEAAAANETETEPSRQDDGRKIVNQVKYFQFANVFGNGSYNAGVGKGNPDHFILQQERADKSRGIFQKRVRWGDKKGGYGEHYWDLNHHKPKIEDDVSSNVDNAKNSNSNNNNNNNSKTSKIQSAADDHERDDHDGVEQDGE